MDRISPRVNIKSTLLEGTVYALKFAILKLRAMSCYFLSRLSNNGNPKITAQFCYFRLYLSINTVSCRLLQRIARMDVD